MRGADVWLDEYWVQRSAGLRARSEGRPIYHHKNGPRRPAKGGKRPFRAQGIRQIHMKLLPSTSSIV